MIKNLIQKINDKSVTIGVIGLGYVGLPLALAFSLANVKVIGFDIDKQKVQKLNEGNNYFRHIENQKIFYAINNNLFIATSDFSRINQVDAIIICVPTPLTSQREPDLSFIRNTMKTLMPYLRSGQLISLESTTYPGTTEEELKPLIESRGFVIGKDIFLVYSSEREDPGNCHFTTQSIPKIIGGNTNTCLEVGIALYSLAIEKMVPVSSTKVAELTKLLENTYRAVNIGLVNELKIVADRMGIDIWEVIDAAATKPFGYVPFYPGPGLGGHCIPIDPFYLTWKAREYGVNTCFIELAGKVNTFMPEWVVAKVTDALNEVSKPVKGAHILILGLAYKKNIDDTRESPAVKLIDLLYKKGAIISYSDPYVPVFPKMRNYHFRLTSIDIIADILSKIDCVLIATDHDIFDYDLIQKHSKLIVDTRRRYRGNYENVIKC